MANHSSSWKDLRKAFCQAVGHSELAKKCFVELLCIVKHQLNARGSDLVSKTLTQSMATAKKNKE